MSKTGIFENFLTTGKSILRRSVAAIRRILANRAADLAVFYRTRHIQGPRVLRLADDECVIVTLLRNAEYFLPEFLDYHRDIGVKHFLLIDNGSTDGTLQQAAQYEDVIVVTNSLPVARYECRLRANIARRLIRGGWFLFLDCDEMFEPPQGAGQRVDGLVRYCNRHGYTSVICQMLDMASAEPLQKSRNIDYAHSLRVFNRYSVAEIKKFDYFDTGLVFAWGLAQNRCDLSEIKVFFGGLRREVFGENCCLTKHSLVRNLPSIKLYTHPHYSSGVVCADFTGLIRHYKFCGDYIARETEQVAKAVWNHGEDVARINHISGKKDFVIAGSDMQTYSSVRDLRNAGFLVASQRFIDEVEVRGPDTV
jgi:glycosyltransferase involved in cell wall biosynthesis